MSSQIKIFLGIIVILIFGTIITVFLNPNTGVDSTSSPQYDTFTQCLKDQGAVFYGAFWCSHCQAQKKEFGSSAKYLPYVECSTPDGQSQTKECIDKKIETYPTWVFADGSRLSGEISLTTLAEKTSCQLPVTSVQ